MQSAHLQQRLASRHTHRPRRVCVPRTASSSSSSTTTVADASSAPSTSTRPAFTYTSYEANTCTLDFKQSGVRVLVDPWLEGDLTFLDQDWLYRGIKRVVGKSLKLDLQELCSKTDVMVLTQGLDDHTHMPTLRALPKTIPVVANPEAAARIAPLGFKQVTVLDHGQSVSVAGGRLRITATAGALVGPPWSKRQNGYTFTEQLQAGQQGLSVYFESHCDFTPSSVAQLGQVDVVISPIVSTLLGKGEASYPLVMGDINLISLIKLLRPKVLLPLMNHEIDYAGPLGDYVFSRGDASASGVEAQLRSAGLNTRVQFPSPPGQPSLVEL